MTAPNYPPPEQPTQPRNGFGTTGFVLGIIGLVLSFIPFVGVIAWPLVILGIVFAGLGLMRIRSRKADNKGLTIAGLVVSIVGLVMCIVWVAATGSALNEVNKESNKVSTIRYEVTGNAKNVDVDYTTFSKGSSDGNQTVKTLPWHKDVQAKGIGKSGIMTVTTGMNGGKVKCRVLVDGKTAKTATAQGEMKTASCSNFGG